MGFYAKRILPRLLDLAMRNKETARLRAEWLPQARGDVLEIGFGSGLNLPFYSSQVQRVYGVEPSRELVRMAETRALDLPLALELLPQSAEEPLPLPDQSIDTIVTTWTLCSIPDAARALRQVGRVLKPDGRLLFIEHGKSPEPAVAAWQNRLTPLWTRLSGGCHLNRRIAELIEAAGYHIAELKTCYLVGPRPMTYTYQGVAQVTAARVAGASNPRA